MSGTTFRVILDAGKGDLVGQAKAAELVLAGKAGDYPDFMGVRCDGKFYGICRNKGSLRIYPQSPPPAPAHDGGTR